VFKGEAVFPLSFNVKDSASRKRTDKAEEAQSNIEPSQQELFKWNPLVDAKYEGWIFILLIQNVNTNSTIGSSVQRRKNESFFSRVKLRERSIRVSGTAEVWSLMKLHLILAGDGKKKFSNVTPCMLPHLLYNPTHALFTL